jgi:hypothetical protein
LLFNLAHAFSHFWHVSDKQFYLVHYTAVIASLAFINVLGQETHKWMDSSLSSVVFFLFFLDTLLIFLNAPHILNIFLFCFIFIIILFFYYDKLTRVKQTNCYWIIVGTILVLFTQILEILYCSTLLSIFPDFPFHIFVEIAAIFPIWLLCKTFI